MTVDEEPQIEEENPWAVVDSDGEVVKGRFASEEDARAWMDTPAGKEILAKRGRGSYDVEQQTGFGLSSEEVDSGMPDEDDDENEE